MHDSWEASITSDRKTWNSKKRRTMHDRMWNCKCILQCRANCERLQWCPREKKICDAHMQGEVFCKDHTKNNQTVSRMCMWTSRIFVRTHPRDSELRSKRPQSEEWYNFLRHYNLVSKPTPMVQKKRRLRMRSRNSQRVGAIEELANMARIKKKKKQARGDRRSEAKRKTVHFATLMDQKRPSGQEVPHIRRPLRCERRFKLVYWFTEQKTSASHMTAAQVLSTLSLYNHLESSTTIPAHKIMGRHSRTSGTTRQKYVRTPCGKIALGATIWKNLDKE